LRYKTLLFGIPHPLLQLTYTSEYSPRLVSAYWFTDPVTAFSTPSRLSPPGLSGPEVTFVIPLSSPVLGLCFRVFQRTTAASFSPPPFGNDFPEAYPRSSFPFGVSLVCRSIHSRNRHVPGPFARPGFETSPGLAPQRTFTALFQAASAHGVYTLQSLAPHPGLARSPAPPAAAIFSPPESACVSAAPPLLASSTGF